MSSTDIAPSPKTGFDLAGLIAAALLLLLAGLIFADLATLDLSSTYGLGPQAMPGVVGGGLVLLAIANAVIALRSGPVERESVDMRAILLILGGLVALIVIMEIGGGFIPGVTILFAATATAFGRRAYLVDLAIGFALSVFIFLLFSKLLTLSLPMGPIERLM